MIRHPIFVVGMPRSGTTLFSSMLDAHPDIAISPETHFYTRCRSASEPGPSADQAWTCLRQQPGVKDMAFSKEEERRIREQVRHPRAEPSDVLRAVETTYADRTGASAWGEKTPDHLAHVPEIFRDFPDAVVVAIVRDPRDVCLSLRGMPWNYDSLLESSLKWRRYARLTERFRRDYPDQFREVRYEDVLDTPERVVREVLDWIGAPFDPAVLAFPQHGDGPADPEREPWKEKVHQAIDPENKEKWRDQMSEGEQVVVEWVAGAMMRAKRYQPQEHALDGALIADLGRVLGQILYTTGRRLWRRWRLPSQSGEHTPGWIRERQKRAEGEE